MNSKYGLKSIRERRLRISNLLELNDPFEFLGVEVSNRQFRKKFQSARKDLASYAGLICFSNNWNSPLQWAHYADNHKGLCLGFDVPRSFLEKVDYVKERIPFVGTLDEEFVLTLLRTKHEHWEYEREYRAFIELKDSENGQYYINFSEDLKLAQVMVGFNSCVSRSQLKKALSNKCKSVKAFKVRPSFKKFIMVEQKRKSLWK